MSSMKTVADDKQGEGDATTAAPIPCASAFAYPLDAASSFFNFVTFPRKSDKEGKSSAKKSKQKSCSSSVETSGSGSSSQNQPTLGLLVSTGQNSHLVRSVTLVNVERVVSVCPEEINLQLLREKQLCKKIYDTWRLKGNKKTQADESLETTKSETKVDTVDVPPIPLPPPPSRKTLADSGVNRSGTRKKGAVDKEKRMESLSSPLSVDHLPKVVSEGGAESLQDSSLQHSIADVRSRLEKVRNEIDDALVNGLPEDDLFRLRDFVLGMDAYFSNCLGRASHPLSQPPNVNQD